MLKSFPCAGFFFFIGFIAIMVVVGVCLMPINQLALPSFYGLDKIEHFFTYFVLSLYFCQVIRQRFYLHCVGLLVMMGILIECLQILTGYRMFDLWDIVANTLGVAAGYFIGKNYGTVLQTCCRKLA